MYVTRTIAHRPILARKKGNFKKRLRGKLIWCILKSRLWWGALPFRVLRFFFWLLINLVIFLRLYKTIYFPNQISTAFAIKPSSSSNEKHKKTQQNVQIGKFGASSYKK